MIGTEWAVLAILGMVTASTAAVFFLAAKDVRRKRWLLRAGLAGAAAAFVAPILASQPEMQTSVFVVIGTLITAVLIERSLQLCRRCSIALYRHNHQGSSAAGLCDDCLTARLQQGRRVYVMSGPLPASQATEARAA